MSNTCIMPSQTTNGGTVATTIDGVKWWTVEEIMGELKRADGRPAFTTSGSVRGWLSRSRAANGGGLKHHPTLRYGPRDARLYNSEEVMAMWRRTTEGVTSNED